MDENNKYLSESEFLQPDLDNFELPEPIQVTVDDDGNQTQTPMSQADEVVEQPEEAVITAEVVEDVKVLDEEELQDKIEDFFVEEEVVEQLESDITSESVDEASNDETIVQATDDEINAILGIEGEDVVKIEQTEGFDLTDLVNIKLEEEMAMIQDEFASNYEEKERRQVKKIDISELTIIDRNAIQQNGDLKAALYTGKASFTIAATKSGYSASMLPLVHKDAQRILYSSLDPVSQQREMYKIIHEKMYDTGVGRMKQDFNYWLRNTAAEDIDTFYYGVYCSTFPDGGNLQVQCNECAHTTGYIIPHDNLVSEDMPGTRQLAADIIREVDSEDKMKNFTLIDTNETYLLEDSGMVIEVKTPSLADLLNIMRNVREEKIKRDRLSVTNMLYVERILLPNKSIQGQYSQVTDRKRILHIIDNLSLDDAELVNSIIGELISVNRLSYSVKDLVCSSCGSPIDDQEFSIEDVLFSAIFDRYQ